MLTVICGEDNVSSREYFTSLTSKYEQDNYEVQAIGFEDLPSLQGRGSSENLFGFKQVFSIQNLGRQLARRKSKDLTALLTKIDQNKQIVLLDWEDSVSARELKTGKIGTIKEFKPTHNVFKFIEACYPTNLASFIAVLREVMTPRSEMFAYIMLTRHIRTLLLIQEGEVPPRLQSWQKQRIMSQLKRWDKDKLVSFYQKLLGLDISLKSGKSLFSLQKSVELLACYYIS